VALTLTARGRDQRSLSIRVPAGKVRRSPANPKLSLRVEQSIDAQDVTKQYVDQKHACEPTGSEHSLFGILRKAATVKDTSK